MVSDTLLPMNPDNLSTTTDGLLPALHYPNRSEPYAIGYPPSAVPCGYAID